ncbi:uncharacterized protein MONOS_9865 [Monocercomonoides exilis]|uniref:uncharacterized protein n=1 Tax=Monocercomonoides exilis TaxID=2049356 RepID=UPI00355AAA84|nr:hypothetical protein MONOS_9865 [Monocercomonoides exilis]|eukprot:MONOS_9865.1-p1 / transcript=MONOS_9865.1 / gene=MONOS_9865 / organism=Monocercomonoides_exilis_PA203 / gene_product=unspecified product / transcript_product=unspecified product / location=Mono_scaffold00423:27893-28414(-) / protein_length=174 / sequence_SO=supercontig / SO=protein_coding / is_pseudo=false
MPALHSSVNEKWTDFCSSAFFYHCSPSRKVHSARLSSIDLVEDSHLSIASMDPSTEPPSDSSKSIPNGEWTLTSFPNSVPSNSAGVKSLVLSPVVLSGSSESQEGSVDELTRLRSSRETSVRLMRVDFFSSPSSHFAVMSSCKCVQRWSNVEFRLYLFPFFVLHLVVSCSLQP